MFWMPWGLMPDKFVVGSDAMPMFAELDVSKRCPVWCLVIGMICSLFAIIYA